MVIIARLAKGHFDTFQMSVNISILSSFQATSFHMGFSELFCLNQTVECEEIFRPDYKKLLFPVQRVATIVASQAAAVKKRVFGGLV